MKSHDKRRKRRKLARSPELLDHRKHESAWLYLPPELLDHSCRWLTHSERLVLRLCCRDWANQLSVSPYLTWNAQGSRDWHHSKSRVRATGFHAIHRWLQQDHSRLRVLHLERISRTQWTCIWSRRFPLLTHLHLRRCRHWLVWPGVESIQCLRITEAKFTDRDWKLMTPRTLPHLRRLSIKACRGITDDGWRAFSAQLWPRLEHLSLDQCGRLTDHGWRSMRLQQLPRLNSLCLVGTAVTDQGWQAFARHRWPLRHLRLVKNRLSLSGWHQFHSQPWPLMEVLVLVHLRPTEEAWELRSSDLPRLLTLSLTHCPVTDADWVDFNRQTWPHLRVLALTGCHGLTDAGWQTMQTAHLPELQRLDLRFCSNLTDVGWSRFATQTWPQLAYLNLVDTSTTLQGWLFFCQATWPSLQQIHIDPSLPLSEPEGWECMQSGRLPALRQFMWDEWDHSGVTRSWLQQTWQLRELHLDKCDHLSGDDWTHLTPEHFPRLEILELFSCGSVNDTSLQWETPWPFLRELRLVGCDLRTWSANPHLLPELGVLDLSNNPLVDAGWAAWARHEWPGLHELFLEHCQLRGHWPRIRCPALFELCLDNNTQLDDHVWPCLFGLPQLRVLSLANCAQLTSRGWRSFQSRRWPHLRYLNLAGCRFRVQRVSNLPLVDTWLGYN